MLGNTFAQSWFWVAIAPHLAQSFSNDGSRKFGTKIICHWLIFRYKINTQMGKVPTPKKNLLVSVKHRAILSLVYTSRQISRHLILSSKRNSLGTLSY
ncbi:MAG: hypothetical protein V7L12_24905 [Nostoc sp.]